MSPRQYRLGKRAETVEQTRERIIAATRELLARDGDRYRGMPLHVGLLGIHLVPGLFPLPVRMTHVISRPLDLGDREHARRDPRAFADLHARVWNECQRFLDRSVAGRARYADALDHAGRGMERLLETIGV